MMGTWDFSWDLSILSLTAICGTISNCEISLKKVIPISSVCGGIEATLELVFFVLGSCLRDSLCYRKVKLVGPSSSTRRLAALSLYIQSLVVKPSPLQKVVVPQILLSDVASECSCWTAKDTKASVRC